MSVLDRLPPSVTKNVSFRPVFLDSVKENQRKLTLKSRNLGKSGPLTRVLNQFL